MMNLTTNICPPGATAALKNTPTQLSSNLFSTLQLFNSYFKINFTLIHRKKCNSDRNLKKKKKKKKKIVSSFCVSQDIKVKYFISFCNELKIYFVQHTNYLEY